MSKQRSSLNAGLQRGAIITVWLVCEMGFILPSDPDPHCEICLSAEHAKLAVSPRAVCLLCACLPAAEKQPHANVFAFTREHDHDEDSSWANW